MSKIRKFSFMGYTIQLFKDENGYGYNVYDCRGKEAATCGGYGDADDAADYGMAAVLEGVN